MVNKRYTVTAALPYANGALHLGHLAGAYLPADIYVRWLRLLDKEVLFVCGSDEHGAAITLRAKKEERSPQEIIDTYHFLNKETFERLGISFDIYHRTSDPLHHETAQAFFSTLWEKGGELEEKTTQQYYDEAFSQFLADRYIIGTCPRCGHSEAYGDQCEKCGSALSPSDLIQPRSILSGTPPILRDTKHWFFRLDQHAVTLRQWITAQTDWKPHVVGQCLSWLDGDLQPRSITRDLDWGVAVPLPEAVGKVLYVWFDAPIGYISATRQWAEDNGKNWEDYWKSEEAELVHFIGKDNIVFHTIIFPAMLQAHGGYVLPSQVPANQFLNLEGKKFSKSRGWVIEQHRYLEDFAQFPNKEDALRYALIKCMPEQKDGDFKWDEFVDAHDNELVANLGNFVHRVLSLTHKYFGGSVPKVQGETKLKTIEGGGEMSPVEILAQGIAPRLAAIDQAIQGFEFRQAAQRLMELSSFGNGILQFNAPWAIHKTEPDSPVIAASLSAALQITAALSIAMQPFLPFTAAKLREQLRLEPLAAGDAKGMMECITRGETLLPPQHLLGEAALLFAKINDRNDNSRLLLIEAQKQLLKNQVEQLIVAENQEANPAFSHLPVKAAIEYDDFAKMDIRTATIVAAERIPKADKLLKITLDVGFETRTVVSGIAEHFAPEALPGQQVLLLANLAPRKLRGVESQGMILMAENADGKLSFVSPTAAWGNGFIVK